MCWCIEMTRRRFMFWVGFGLFGLAEKLRAESLDALAAAAMEAVEPKSVSTETPWPVHWTVADDEKSRWFEREHFIDDEWRLTGMTRPVNKETGEAEKNDRGYLDESLVPADVRSANKDAVTAAENTHHAERDPHLPEVTRRKRHGRPPSKWLRSLNADELRIWLNTIKVPEAEVSGMTYWTHLTRDHSFEAAKIEGLLEAEQAKLHAAAHFGY